MRQKKLIASIVEVDEVLEVEMVDRNDFLVQRCQIQRVPPRVEIDFLAILVLGFELKEELLFRVSQGKRPGQSVVFVLKHFPVDSQVFLFE